MGTAEETWDMEISMAHPPFLACHYLSPKGAVYDGIVEWGICPLQLLSNNHLIRSSSAYLMVSLACDHFSPACSLECSATLLLFFVPACSDTLSCWMQPTEVGCAGTAIPRTCYGWCCPANWCWGWCMDDANEVLQKLEFCYLQQAWDSHSQTKWGFTSSGLTFLNCSWFYEG